MKKNVIGHSTQIDFIISAFQKGRLATAYIFSGISGVGKFTAAKNIASQICTNIMDVKIVSPTYIDNGEIISIEKAKSLGIDKKNKPLIRIEQIREISYFMQTKPIGNRKIVVIDDIQNIQESGMNAVLKNLEEPKEYLTFILISSGEVSDTIKSRCQRIEFKRLSESELKAISVLNGVDISNILPFSNGSYGQAIATKETLEQIPQHLVITDLALNNHLDCLKLAKDISELPYDKQITLLNYISACMWEKHKDVAMFELFSFYISRVSNRLNARLNIESLFLKFLKSNF